jgi:hypothetical protein
LDLRKDNTAPGGAATMRKSDKSKTFLQLIDRKKFDALCKKWGMDKGVRTYNAWEQTCALVASYVLRLSSLREIESTLGIPRSTFSDANSNRAAGFFEELCQVVLMQIRERCRGRKIRRALLALDSTECQVHGAISSWPVWKQRRSKQGGAKLHVVWDVEGEWIEDFRVTPERRHDSPIGNQFKISSKKLYVFDRAYDDLAFWWKITEHESDFVTRLKSYPRFRYHRQMVLSQTTGKTGVLWEGPWQPSKSCLKLHPEIPTDFTCRHIIYRDPETKRVFDFVTSDRKSPAQSIADAYRKRWAVELLFKWLKGHLNIRYLAVRNPNAVRIQLTIATLTQLLIQLYKQITKSSGTLWECLRALRAQIARQGLKMSGLTGVYYSRALLEAHL